MRRRIHRSPFSASGMVRRIALVLFLALLAALFLRAQEATPPPPPPDAASPADAGSPASPDTTPAPPQSTVRAVRLSDVEGQVQVYENGAIAFDQAEPNMPAVEGMRFVTGDNGRLEIEFEDGSVARVAPDSSIRLTQLRRNADGTTVTLIDALTGLSYYELNAQGGQYGVRFAGDNATPLSSAVFRLDLDASPNELAVMHGAVHVADAEGMISLDVHPSQTFQTDPRQPGEYTVADLISANSWDQWNSDRDQALEQLEAAESASRADTGEPNNPAWNDLDYYGNWYNVPGYGQVWSPAGVGAGWDPFGNGYWGYYNSFGYTWISGYPWGWWPYHCGAWDFLGGWGWIWVPGNCGFGAYGAGWYPYAGVWRVPRGYHPPMRPRRPMPPAPGHGPRPAPLIGINRGPQYASPFRFAPGSRPEARPLTLAGQTIAPLNSSIHPLPSGSVGEPFITTYYRMHPQVPHASIRSAAPPRGPYNPTVGVRPVTAPPMFGTPHNEIGRPQPPRTAAPTGTARPAAGGGQPHPNFGGGRPAGVPSGAHSAPSGAGHH